MNEENPEIVRQLVKDVDFFWSLLDEYVVWDLRRAVTVPDLDPDYVGRAAVIAGRGATGERGMTTSWTRKR